ncbi:hypothetical protein Y032_0579g243 [Ancylostoma ceylanicum]|nr:hypothetical protein Y032_0579g243 [Ancylostoma ceylanicum]
MFGIKSRKLLYKSVPNWSAQVTDRSVDVECGISTNVDEARRVLKESGLPIISADDLADAAEKAVAALK